MDKLELQKLRDLPIEGVAERLGLQVTRHKSLCPFHEDSHPSLSFKVSKNTCRCFVCMTQSIGPIDLVMRHLRMDFKEACRWLADEHNIILDEWKPAPTDEVQKPFDASRYERFFERPWLNDEARRFLFTERRLDPRVVRWCRLTSWTDRHGTPWLQIPYYDREGKLIGVQNRNLTPGPSPKERGEKGVDGLSTTSQPTTSIQTGDVGVLARAEQGSTSTTHSPHLPQGGFCPSGNEGTRGELRERAAPRFRFPQGSKCGIYNLPVLNRLREGDELYIAEGASDCWALLSAGHKAIAIPSATLLSRQDREQLSTLNSQLSISYHMYPDNDVPGERLFLQLKEVLPDLVHHQLPMGCKDYAELFKLTN